MSDNTVAEMKKNLGNSTFISISFDTTGSMSSCIKDVIKKLRDLVEMLMQDMPGIKIGLIAHGDYCDGVNAIQSIDFTDNVESLMNFLQNAPMTSGGDAPECYELALNKACSMSWPAEGGAFILIGDAEPHEPDYVQNTDHLDWKVELNNLKSKNVKVFALQCLKRNHNTGTNTFWENVSESGQTPLLLLETFEESTKTIGAVAAAMHSPEALERYKSSSSEVCSMSYCSTMDRLTDFAASRDEK